MTQTFDELAAQRDPLYAAMKPVGDMRLALLNDHTCQYDWYWTEGQRDLLRMERDLRLFPLITRAHRNQGEPYYTEAQLNSNHFVDCLFLQKQKVQP